MAKSKSNGFGVTPRSNANIHGRPAAQSGANNPQVHSKAVRRYGANSSTGNQPTKPLVSDAWSAASVAHKGATGKPKSESVGFATDGSGTFKHATHQSVATGGINRGSTAGLKNGMRYK